PNRRLAPEAIFRVAFFSEKNQGESIPGATLRHAASILADVSARFARVRNQPQVAGKKPLPEWCAHILRDGATACATSKHRNHERTVSRKDAPPSLFVM